MITKQNLLDAWKQTSVYPEEGGYDLAISRWIDLLPDDEKESKPTPEVITRKELGEFMFWHGVADDIILDVFIKHFKGRIVE